MLRFFTIRHVRERWDLALPSIHQLTVYSAKQKQNAVPSFRYSASLVCQKNLELEQINLFAPLITEKFELNWFH